MSNVICFGGQDPPIDRLEEVGNQSSWETLRQFDARLETAAQSVMKAEWLEELVNAGGSPAEALRLPSTEPSKQVNIPILPPSPPLLLQVTRQNLVGQRYLAGTFIEKLSCWGSAGRGGIGLGPGRDRHPGPGRAGAGALGALHGGLLDQLGCLPLPHCGGPPQSGQSLSGLISSPQKPLTCIYTSPRPCTPLPYFACKSGFCVPVSEE